MTQSDVLITGGRILDPLQQLDKNADLLIQNGLVARIGEKGSIRNPDGARVIHAEGLIVCPGFIDLHCHLREPGYEDKETIQTGTMAAAVGGFTTICCMPNTNPPVDDYATVEFIKKKASTEGKIRVLPIACITKGRKGTEITEMMELAEAGVAGFSDDGNSVPGSSVMLLAMECCRNLGLPIMEHCEDKGIAGSGVINEGWVSVKLGLKGIPSEAEEIIVSRDIALAKLTHAKLHICHASTRGTVELIRNAKKSGVDITAEVTPHHLTLTEENVIKSKWESAKYSSYNSNTKVNPPLRTQMDIDALIQGLKEGVIDAIATDHAPHTSVDKLCELDQAAFGISGLETAFGCLMSLVQNNAINLSELVSALTCKPAGILHNAVKERIGSLVEGASGDVAIIDINKKWKVDTGKFYSKGKNSPYHNAEFIGKVVITVYKGQIVYSEE